MNESTIIQKLIHVGIHLEAGNIEYSGAEADVKYLLAEYLKLKSVIPNK